MKLEDAKKRIDALALEATADEDGLIAVYFSREDERYAGQNVGMTAADAMIVVRNLVGQFAIDPDFVMNLPELKTGGVQ